MASQRARNKTSVKTGHSVYKVFFSVTATATAAALLNESFPLVYLYSLWFMATMWNAVAIVTRLLGER